MDEHPKPKQSMAQAEGSLSTFAHHDRTETSRRADNAELLNALPSLPIARASILEALRDSRADR